MKNKKRKMGKIIFSLIGIFIFIIFIGSVSASLYEDFGRLESQKCNVTDYGKISSVELKNKFYSASALNCTFILDYFPFESNTINLIKDYPFYYTGAYSSYYGQIEHYIINNHEYIFLFGKNSTAINKVMGLVADYQNHSALLRENYVNFFRDYYFKAYENGTKFVAVNESMPPIMEVDNCVDNSSANAYTNRNTGNYTISGNITNFYSFCANKYTMVFPYCFNETAYLVAYSECDCIGERCKAHLYDVFYWIRWLGKESVTEDFLYSVFKNWLKEEPVAYYKFEGNYVYYAQDFSGYDNHGILMQGASIINNAIRGNALSLDGVNDFVVVSASYIDGDYGIPSSFAFWVYPKSQLGAAGTIMHKGDASARGGCDYEPLISINKNGLLSASADGCKGGGIIGNVKLPLNQWSHVVVVFSNNIGKIYVNGQLNVSKSKPYSFTLKETGRNHLYIGAGSNYGAPVNFFNGMIDEVKIWNYALSDQEVLNEYNL